MGPRGHVLPSPEIKQLKLKNDFPLFQKIKGPSNTKSTNGRSIWDVIIVLSNRNQL